MSQNIRFPLRWIIQISKSVFEIQYSNQNTSESLDKRLNDIRNDLLLSSNIVFASSSHRTNFCKKLIYLIKKIYNVNLKVITTQTLEEKLYMVTKFVLKRGANYLSQESLHLANYVVKTCEMNAFAFYEEFTKLADSL